MSDEAPDEKQAPPGMAWTRSMSREKLARFLSFGEDAIYLVVGLLLASTAATILHSTTMLFIESARAGEIVHSSVAILDAALLVLLIVEIMHTIRVSIVAHTLVVEPFLVVALIAGVRRVLILSVEAAEFLPDQPNRFERVMHEFELMIIFFPVLVGSLVLMKRFADSRS